MQIRRQSTILLRSFRNNDNKMKLSISILILSSGLVATIASNRNPWQASQQQLIDYPFTVEIIRFPPKQTAMQAKPSESTNRRPCPYCGPPKENPWASSRPAPQPPKYNNPWAQGNVHSTSSPLVPRPSQLPPLSNKWSPNPQQQPNPWRPKPQSKPQVNPWQPSQTNPWQWQ